MTTTPQRHRRMPRPVRHAALLLLLLLSLVATLMLVSASRPSDSTAVHADAQAHASLDSDAEAPVDSLPSATSSSPSGGSESDRQWQPPPRPTRRTTPTNPLDHKAKPVISDSSSTSSHEASAAHGEIPADKAPRVGANVRDSRSGRSGDKAGVGGRPIARRWRHSAVLDRFGRSVTPIEREQAADAGAGTGAQAAAGAGSAQGEEQVDDGATGTSESSGERSKGKLESDAVAAALDSTLPPGVNASLPFDDVERLAAQAQQLTQSGCTVLHYDVTYSESARLLDEDENVRAVECAWHRMADSDGSASDSTSSNSSPAHFASDPSSAFPANSTLRLSLVVIDGDEALESYAVGSIVHGSDLWRCTPNGPSDAQSDDGGMQILGRVIRVAAIESDAHALELHLEQATTRQLFEEATILFQQPEQIMEQHDKSEAATADEPATDATAESSEGTLQVAKAAASHHWLLRVTKGSHPLPSTLPLQQSAAADAASGSDSSAEIHATSRFLDSDPSSSSRPSNSSSLSSLRHRAAAGRWHAQADANVYDISVTPGDGESLFRANGVAQVRFRTRVAFSKAGLSVSVWRHDPNGASKVSEGGSAQFQCQVGAQCLVTLSLSSFGITPSLWGYSIKVEFSKACDFLLFGCSASGETEQFWMPIVVADTITLGGGQVAAFTRSCSQLKCASGALDWIDRTLCAICSPTRSVELSMQCRGCRLEYEASVSKALFGWSLIPPRAYGELHADARIKADVQVDAALDFALHSESSHVLVRPTNLPISWGFSILGVQIGLYAQLELGLATRLDLSTHASLTTSASVSASLKAHTFLDTDRRGESMLQNYGEGPMLQWNNAPSVRIDASGEAALEIALQPKLTVGLSFIAAVALATEAFVRVDAAAQYPPFPPLSQPYRLPAPLPPPLANWGACDAPHLLRYGVSAGVRNATLQPRLDFSLGSKVLGVDWLDYVKQFAAIPLGPSYLVRAQLLSGCLLPLSIGPDRPDYKQALALRQATSMDDAQQTAFQLNLRRDLSEALGVATNRLRLQLLDANQRPLSTSSASSRAHVMSLDSSTGPESHAAAVFHPMATSTVSGVELTLLPPSDSSSSERPAVDVARDLRQQLATPDSTLTRAVAARMIRPPVSFDWSSTPVSWSPCNAQCGGGVQSGSLACVGSDGSTAGSVVCGAAIAPTTSRACNTHVCGSRDPDAAKDGNGSASSSSTRIVGLSPLHFGVACGGAGVALLLLLAIGVYLYRRRRMLQAKEVNSQVVPFDSCMAKPGPAAQTLAAADGKVAPVANKHKWDKENRGAMLTGAPVEQPQSQLQPGSEGGRWAIKPDSSTAVHLPHVSPARLLAQSVRVHVTDLSSTSQLESASDAAAAGHGLAHPAAACAVAASAACEREGTMAMVSQSEPPVAVTSAAPSDSQPPLSTHMQSIQPVLLHMPQED